MTRADPGSSPPRSPATTRSARWKSDPATAVTAIGEGLRALHEALPTARFPFSWSAEQRLAGARRQAAAGRLDPAAWHPWHPCHPGQARTVYLKS